MAKLQDVRRFAVCDALLSNLRQIISSVDIAMPSPRYEDVIHFGNTLVFTIIHKSILLCASLPKNQIQEETTDALGMCVDIVTPAIPREFVAYPDGLRRTMEADFIEGFQRAIARVQSMCGVTIRRAVSAEWNWKLPLWECTPDEYARAVGMSREGFLALSRDELREVLSKWNGRRRSGARKPKAKQNEKRDAELVRISKKFKGPKAVTCEWNRRHPDDALNAEQVKKAIQRFQSLGDK